MSSVELMLNERLKLKVAFFAKYSSFLSVPFLVRLICLQQQRSCFCISNILCCCGEVLWRTIQWGAKITFVVVLR